MLTDSLLMIDGSAMLSKHYYGTIPKELFKEKNSEKIEVLQREIKQTSYGVYTNAVTSMLCSIMNIIKNYHPKYMVVCFDTMKNTFRQQIYSQYKETRRQTPNPLIEQFQLMQQILESIGIKVIISSKYEADDYAGTLAHKFEKDVDVYILTRDQDYYQLATNRTTILMMQTNEEKLSLLEKRFNKHRYFENSFPFNTKEVKDWIGVYSYQIPDLKGIAGDVSDNIPGIDGINTAAKNLLNVYSSIEELYSDLEKMKYDSVYKQIQIKIWKSTGLKRSPYNMLIKNGAREQAIMSKKLATIIKTIPLDLALDNLTVNINENNLETIKNILELE